MDDSDDCICLDDSPDGTDNKKTKTNPTRGDSSDLEISVITENNCEKNKSKNKDTKRREDVEDDDWSETNFPEEIDENYKLKAKGREKGKEKRGANVNGVNNNLRSIDLENGWSDDDFPEVNVNGTNNLRPKDVERRKSNYDDLAIASTSDSRVKDAKEMNWTLSDFPEVNLNGTNELGPMDNYVSDGDCPEVDVGRSNSLGSKGTKEKESSDDDLLETNFESQTQFRSTKPRHESQSDSESETQAPGNYWAKYAEGMKNQPRVTIHSSSDESEKSEEENKGKKGNHKHLN